MNLIPQSLDYHRNGICGIGFHVGIVKDSDGSKKLIIQFENQTGCTAVLDLELLKQENIKFGENSWRGDQYESIFKALVESEAIQE